MSEQLGGVPCTEILPVEMWEAILEHVESTLDLYHCYQTCGTWKEICRSRVIPSLLLQMLTSQKLWSYYYLSYPELVKCRQVCRHWKQLVDDTWSQEDWEEVAHKRTPSSSNYYYKSSGVIKVSQGTVVRMRKDTIFLNSIAKNAGGGGECGDNNPFVSRTLRYTFCRPIKEVGRIRQSSFDTIASVAGKHVVNLDYRFCNGNGMEPHSLSCLFLHFPNLQRLKLDFRLSRGRNYFDSWEGREEISERETSLLELLQEFKNRNELRLGNLAELTLTGLSPVQMVILPHLISFLISGCAPHLQKVTFVWEPQPGRLMEVREKYTMKPVLAACADAKVKKLLLLGWAESLRLSKLLLVPKGEPPSWPLTSLTVRVELLSVRSSSRSLVALFYDILKLFWGSLEELHIETTRRNLVCCGQNNTKRGNASVAPGPGRRCGCNKCYNMYQSHRIVSEFQDNCDSDWVLQRVFSKLAFLSIPHGLLHPALFPGLMKTCPSLRQLRINDLMMKEESMGGEMSVEVVQVQQVHQLVCELWGEAPHWLREIVVSRWGGDQKGDYICRRTMFQEDSGGARRRKTTTAVGEAGSCRKGVSEKRTRQKKRTINHTCLLS